MSAASSSTAARITQLVLVLLAATGAAAGLAWATGLIGVVGGDDRAHETASVERAEPAHAPASASPAAPAPPAAAPSSGGEAPARVARYAVCGREEAPARLFALPSRVAGALWAVSCGATAHVIAIEAEQGILLARRVARLSLPSPSPDRAPRPAPLALLSADATWLVTTLRVDRNGSPAGGALFRVPLEAGDLLGAASRVHDAAPGALAIATLDRAPGQDFALLQLGDPRVAQAGELWLFSGGAAPLRIARRSVEPDAFALAASDLDGDGSDEIAVLARSGRVTVHSASDSAPPATVAAPGGDGAYALDVDGDGKREIVIGGARAQRLELTSNSQETTVRQLAATPVPSLDGLRDLVELDADADGRLDIAGYAHPRIVAIAGKSGATGTRRTLFELSGEGFAVVQVVPTELDGDGRMDLIALIAGENNDPQIELMIATGPPDIAAIEARARIPSGGNELRNAPLIRELELR
jgi:hypothetical protein